MNGTEKEKTAPRPSPRSPPSASRPLTPLTPLPPLSSGSLKAESHQIPLALLEGDSVVHGQKAQGDATSEVVTRGRVGSERRHVRVVAAVVVPLAKRRLPRRRGERRLVGRPLGRTVASFSSRSFQVFRFFSFEVLLGAVHVDPPAHLHGVQGGDEQGGDVGVGRLFLVTPQPHLAHRRLEPFPRGVQPRHEHRRHDELFRTGEHVFEGQQRRLVHRAPFPFPHRRHLHRHQVHEAVGGGRAAVLPQWFPNAPHTTHHGHTLFSIFFS